MTSCLGHGFGMSGYGFVVLEELLVWVMVLMKLVDRGLLCVENDRVSGAWYLGY